MTASAKPMTGPLSGFDLALATLPTDADQHAEPTARLVRRCARCNRLTLGALCGLHSARCPDGHPLPVAMLHRCARFVP